MDLVSNIEDLEDSLDPRLNEIDMLDGDVWHLCQSILTEHEQREQDEQTNRHIVWTLQLLLGLSYWTRLWTVQEIQSQREVTFIYGNRILSSVQLWRALKSHQHPFKTEKRCWSITLENSLSWWSRKDGGELNKAKEMIPHILEFRYHACSNMLDRVYALRSAFSNTDSQLPVDYTIPPERLLVYTIRNTDHEVQLTDITKLIDLFGLKLAQVRVELQAFNIDMLACFQGSWHDIEPSASRTVQGSSRMLMDGFGGRDVDLGYSRDWQLQPYYGVVLENHKSRFMLALREMGIVDIYSISEEWSRQDGDHFMHPTKYCATFSSTDFSTESLSGNILLSGNAALVILAILEDVHMKTAE
jgi:hypothetical protein